MFLVATNCSTACIFIMQFYRIPSTPDPSGLSVVMDPTEFARIKVSTPVDMYLII